MNQVISPKSSSTTASLSERKDASSEADSNSSGDQPLDHAKVKIKGRGWTLGSSTSLVEGAEEESILITIAWIVIPIAICALLFVALIYR